MKKKWFYKGDLLRNYLKKNIKNQNNLDCAFYYVTDLIKKEYVENTNIDDLIDNILNRDKIKEIMNNPLIRVKRKSWSYMKKPLKEYLKTIVDEKDLEFLYSKIRRILEKEYTNDVDLDKLIEDILNRKEIKNIILKEYKKRNKNKWVYNGILLKDYLKTIVDEEDLEFLYQSICVCLRNEYKDDIDLNCLIDDILKREKFINIINGNYQKLTSEKWYYKGIPLIEYVKKNIKSEYRTSYDITILIKSYVERKIKNNNLKISYREQLIEKYINSKTFKKTISEKPKEKKEYYYKGIKLRQYISNNIENPDNLNYVYNYVINKINTTSEDLDIIINSKEVVNFLKTDYIKKQEKENWLYKNGLLIDYLKTIDLYNKKLINVYIQIKSYISTRYIDGFENIFDKQKAIEKYVDSQEFQNYLKYGYTNRATYYYKDMLLIDYIRLNYKEKFKNTNLNDNNIYSKIIYYLRKEYDLDSLTMEQRELLIDKYLNSNEFIIYINTIKTKKETWDYYGVSLKNIISEYYSEIIENEYDLNNIYNIYVNKAHKIKSKDKYILNEQIFNLLLTDEFVNKTKEEYVKRKQTKKEVFLKQELYRNKDDLSYIYIYCIDNKLDFNKILEIQKQGFDYYSSIMLMEYSIKYNSNIESLIKTTNEIKNRNNKNDNDYLWLYKLGYREYIYYVIKDNEKKIDGIIYKQMYINYKNKIYIDKEEIYSILIELLLKKHIVFTSNREYLFNSFISFVKSFANRYFLELYRNKMNVTLDDDIKYNKINNSENIEEEIIDKDITNIISKQINDLSDIEQYYVKLRYGFIDRPHDLYEIKQKFSKKNIYFTIKELEQLEINVLSKLKDNPKILSLKKK